ncbi:hypothetical protein EG329_012179 [Mollisiaceae sp. DMI_Dod_QoI]|nr:hypothetical protein EG329_012179 [Helotiales sp. DMI_Dod_QoI]
MAGPMQSFVPEEQDSYLADISSSNPQYEDSQQRYRPQQYTPDSRSWPEISTYNSSQVLEGQAMINALGDANFDGEYDFESIDPALWQYDDEEYAENHGTTSSIHIPSRTIMTNPRLQSQVNIDRTIPKQHPNNDGYLGHTSEEKIVPAPAKQPFSQVFVVPITNQTHDSESFPSSNGMFCDFPGIAFRSFLPEGAISPVSTSRTASMVGQGKKPILKSGLGKPVVMQGPTQPQVYKPFRSQAAGGSDSSANSTPHATSISRLTTPDIV